MGAKSLENFYLTTPFRPSKNIGNTLYILHASLQLQHSLKYTHVFLLRVKSLLHSPLHSHYEVDEDHFWINSHSLTFLFYLLKIYVLYKDGAYIFTSFRTGLFPNLHRFHWRLNNRQPVHGSWWTGVLNPYWFKRLQEVDIKTIGLSHSD